MSLSEVNTRAIARRPCDQAHGCLYILWRREYTPCAFHFTPIGGRGEVMFPIEMKHIGKIDAVGTVRIFGYPAGGFLAAC